MATQSDGKLKALYSGHSDEVQVVAWSPKGTNIASGSNDTTVQLLYPLPSSRSKLDMPSDEIV